MAASPVFGVGRDGIGVGGAKVTDGARAVEKTVRGRHGEEERACRGVAFNKFGIVGGSYTPETEAAVVGTRK